MSIVPVHPTIRNRPSPSPAPSSGHGVAVWSEAAAKEYEKLLTDARIQRSPNPIANRYPAHCKMAASHLLQLAVQLQQARRTTAPTRIRILTGTLTKHVYSPEIADRLISFLAAGGEVRALIWNTPDYVRGALEGSGALNSLTKAGDFEVRFSGTRNRGEDINHFFVVGVEAYRLEAPHPYVDGDDFTDTYPEIPAQICFNDPETASKLVAFFDAIWDSVPRIPNRTAETTR